MAKMGTAFDTPFDLVLGRRTYDIFAAHWTRTEEPPAALFNACTKYLATSRPDSADWGPMVHLGDDPAAALAEIKAGDGPDLLVQGSSSLGRAILAAGLFDEIQIWTFPVILGAGKRVFDGATLPGALELVDSATSGTGVLMNVYRPKGPIETGSFALE